MMGIGKTSKHLTIKDGDYIYKVSITSSTSAVYSVSHLRSNYRSTGTMKIANGSFYVSDKTALQDVPVNGDLADQIIKYMGESDV